MKTIQSLLFFFILVIIFLVYGYTRSASQENPFFVGTIGAGEWNVYLSREVKERKGDNIYLRCIRKPSELVKKKMDKELTEYEKQYEDIAKEMGSKIDRAKAREFYFKAQQFEQTCELNCKTGELVVILPGGNMILRAIVESPEEVKKSLINEFCKSH